MLKLGVDAQKQEKTASHPVSQEQETEATICLNSPQLGSKMNKGWPGLVFLPQHRMVGPEFGINSMISVSRVRATAGGVVVWCPLSCLILGSS